MSSVKGFPTMECEVSKLITYDILGSPVTYVFYKNVLLILGNRTGINYIF
jgi:hypothetical protein